MLGLLLEALFWVVVLLVVGFFGLIAGLALVALGLAAAGSYWMRKGGRR